MDKAEKKSGELNDSANIAGSNYNQVFLLPGLHTMYLNLNFPLRLIEVKGNEIATSQVIPLSKSIYIYH
jgi:hypothetical protein